MHSWQHLWWVDGPEPHTEQFLILEDLDVTTIKFKTALDFEHKHMTIQSSVGLIHYLSTLL